eukprot:NODE_2_length_91304_cov_0.692462.p57 type:complete len:177 gc:universal NODE_2_length_91304_cov_0.692462:22315-21785(-)
MTSTLPRPLLKLFAPRPALDYLPPVTKIERKIGFGPSRPFLDGLQNVELMDTSEDKIAYKEKLKQQFEHRNDKDAEKTKNAFSTLFLGRLPKDINKNDLLDILERFGKIVHVRIIMTKRAHYAFVEFSNEQDARKALRGCPKTIKQKRIVVDLEKGRTFKQFLPNKYKLIRGELKL